MCTPADLHAMITMHNKTTNVFCIYIFKILKKDGGGGGGGYIFTFKVTVRTRIIKI